MNENRPYMLFSGDEFYPEGGWDDFRGAFETVDEAKSAVPDSADWAHIVDAEAELYIARFARWGIQRENSEWVDEDQLAQIRLRS